MPKLSVCIIVYNEETKIERCLESVSFADEIIVVDAGSSDRTVELAGRFTEKIFIREFSDYSDQKNYAVSKAGGDWILSIDADETVDDRLRKEVLHTVNAETVNEGYYINRINFMYGKRLDHFHQPDLNLRLFRKGAGKFVQPVHEYFECPGPVGRLENPLMHYSIAGLKEHIRKAAVYTTLEVECLRQKGGLVFWKCLFGLAGKPVFRFFQNYFYYNAWKEGMTGLVISFNSALYEMVRQIKCLFAVFQKTPFAAGGKREKIQ